MVAVRIDKSDGEEVIFSVMEIDNVSYFSCINLPKGSIKKLIGRELTPEDDAVVLIN